MSLQIKTNSISNAAGSLVNGTLHLHIHNDASGPLIIDHLAITLTGRAQTDIDHSTQKRPGCVFQSRRLLFATKKTLIKDSTSIPTSSCTWAFELQIPSRCTVREAAAHTFRRWDRFDPEPRQRLPPAFASYSSSPSSSGSTTAAANAAIIYELRASALVRGRGQGEGVRKLDAVESIDFTTIRDVKKPVFCQTAARAQVALQSARLLTQEQWRLHVPRRLRAAASAKPPPFAAFELVLRGSRAGIIGQSFPLDLRIAHDEDDGSTSQAGMEPTVFLSHLKVSLRAHTSVRCWGTKCFEEKGECALLHRGDESADWQEEIQIDSSDLTILSETDGSRGRKYISNKFSSKSPGLEIPVVDDHDDDTSALDLHQHTTIPTYFVPSFKTFIISRT
ncbi:MAG: hypothetical protein LQ350_000244 [Teloschistes chrysophthalmus]|nr:MAG: hypothetical protein LQ350_000244 [Niorma chrysophthalma]